MKKLIALFAAALLALGVVAPAIAAPDAEKNKHVDYWEIVCEPLGGTFTVVAKGIPGWRTDDGPGNTPIHLRAGVFAVWAESSLVEGPFPWGPPKGLEKKDLIGPCFLHLDGGSRAVFDIEISDAYFLTPGA
jgi:hypothetical protein